MNNSDYPEQPPEYQQGYQLQSPPVYHPIPPQPAPGLAYPQPQQTPVPPGQMSYAQPYPQQMPYPQQGQMMMPPQQINLMVSNVNNNVAMAGVGSMIKRHPPTIVRLIWFFCIGLWLGCAWISFALFFMCTIVGIPLGVMMLKQVPTIMLL